MNFMYGINSQISKCCLNYSVRQLHLGTILNHVVKLTRLRVVDNSKIGKEAMMEGRPPRVIHVYNKRGIGEAGDIVLMAVKGNKIKGIVVGCVKRQPALRPRFDSNNVVLIDDNGSPLGNRVHVPIPTHLRKTLAAKSHVKRADYTKLLSIATKYV